MRKGTVYNYSFLPFISFNPRFSYLEADSIQPLLLAHFMFIIDHFSCSSGRV